jgi:hypothetical protein
VPWLLALLAGVVVAGAGLGGWALWGRVAQETAPTTEGLTTTFAVSTTTTTEPLLVADTPPIYAAAAGPQPAVASSGGGAGVVLQPIDSVSLDERAFLQNLDHLTNISQSGGEFPNPTLTAVGQIPGTGYRLFSARGINGFVYDPDVGKPGECYYLFGIRPQPAQVSADCFTSPDAPTPTALWSGIESLGVYAWADLPPQASMAVLTVGGSAQMWQVPRSGVAAFSYTPSAADVTLVVLDATGAEIAHADRTPRTPPPTGPITGYGDYAGTDPADLPWHEVWPAVARCMTEHGYDTIGFDVGLFYLEVPGTEEPVDAVARACLEGMGLPPDITRADQ